MGQNYLNKLWTGKQWRLPVRECRMMTLSGSNTLVLHWYLVVLVIKLGDGFMGIQLIPKIHKFTY